MIRKLSHIVGSLFVVSLAVVVPPPAHAVDGDLDTTLVQPDVLTRLVCPYGGTQSSLAMARQSDGKIVAAGSVDHHTASHEDFGVFRFDAVDGAFDTTFGGGDGIVSFDASGPYYPNNNDWPEAIALQTVGGNDDWILVGGRGYDSGQYFDYVVARVTPDGVLDTSFGGAGTGLAHFGTIAQSEILTDLAVDNGVGNIAAVAYFPGGTASEYDFAIALLDPDGNLVTSFDSDGMLTIDFGGTFDAAYAVAFDSAGDIVIAGESDGFFALAKVDQSGALVGTFGVGGLLVTGIDGAIRDVICEGTDVFVLGSTGGSFKFAKLDAYGNLYDGVDASPEFGVGGSQVLIFGVGDGASTMGIDASGKIWGVGGGGSGRYAVARVTSTGAVDQTFGTTVRSDPARDPAGKVLIAGTDFSPDSAFHQVGLVIEPGGTAVLGARTSSGNPYALVRVGSDGMIDRSLSQPGTDAGKIDPRMQFRDLARTPDGDVIAAGIRDYNPVLRRMEPDGLFDPSFGPGIFAGIDSNRAGTTGFDHLGRAELNLAFEVQIHAADVDRNGKIVVAGGVGSITSPDDSLLARFNADGSLDSTFSQGDPDGIDGVLVMNTSPTGSPNGFSEVEALADGDLLACGGACNLNSGYYFFYLTLARFNEDGSLDADFATADDGIDDIAGLYSLKVGEGPDRAEQLLVDDQGRILVVGGKGGLSTNYNDSTVVRFTADGVLDPTFGVDGIGLYDIAGLATGTPEEDHAYDGALQSDGRLVFSGTATIGSNDRVAVARIDSSGVLDPSFGGGAGYTITNVNSWDAYLDLQPDGKPVVAGGNFKVQRFDNDGALDESFGVDGVVDHGDSWAMDVMVLPGWKILVGGESPDRIARLVNTDLGEPEIDVQRPAGTSIADGGIDDVGVIEIGTVNLTYTIDNSVGLDQLTVSDVSASGLTNVDNFSVSTTLPILVDWNASATLTVSFDVTGEGVFGFDLDISNDDPDEATYDIAVTGAVTPTSDVVLMPDALPLLADLRLWLRGDDLCATLDHGDGVATWPDASGLGNDAIALTTLRTDPLFVLGDVPALRFPPDPSDELMRAAGLFGGSSPTDLTILTAYRTAATESNVRPVGFGSRQQGEPADNFNLAVDPSIRKDGGAITGYTRAHPRDEYFVRAATMDSASGDVQEYFDSLLALDVNEGFTVATDNFYVGDIRNTINTDHFDVAEVVVYERALTPDERLGVEAYLNAKYRSLVHLRFEEGAAGQQVPAGGGGVLDFGFTTNDAEAHSLTANLPLCSSDVALAEVPRTAAANNLSLDLEREDEQVLTVPDDPSLDLVGGFTIEGWVKLETLADDADGLDETDQQALVAKERAWAKRQGDDTSYIFLAQAGDLASSASHGSGSHNSLLLVLETDPAIISVVSSLQITDSAWHFVGVTFDPDAGEVDFMLDSQVETISGVSEGGHVNDFDLVVGGRPTAATGVYAAHLDGLVDELRITGEPLASDRLLNFAEQLFVDGFESGDTSAWSVTRP